LTRSHPRFAPPRAFLPPNETRTSPALRGLGVRMSRPAPIFISDQITSEDVLRRAVREDNNSGQRGNVQFEPFQKGSVGIEGQRAALIVYSHLCRKLDGSYQAHSRYRGYVKSSIEVSCSLVFCSRIILMWPDKGLDRATPKGNTDRGSHSETRCATESWIRPPWPGIMGIPAGSTIDTRASHAGFSSARSACS
jgi:hypothetical protein